MTQLRTINGAPLSSLCFGTMQFGGTAGADMSLTMYDACRKTGVNHFDTAHVYTGGASERCCQTKSNTSQSTMITQIYEAQI